MPRQAALWMETMTELIVGVNARIVCCGSKHMMQCKLLEDMPQVCSPNSILSRSYLGGATSHRQSAANILTSIAQLIERTCRVTDPRARQGELGVSVLRVLAVPVCDPVRSGRQRIKQLCRRRRLKLLILTYTDMAPTIAPATRSDQQISRKLIRGGSSRSRA